MVGGTYGVISIVCDPKDGWLKYQLENVQGTFLAVDFYDKRLNYLAVSESSFVPEVGTKINRYDITVFNVSAGTWTPTISNQTIEKVVAYAKNCYDITTSFATYHTIFKHL